jgi:hypothetical protein
VIALCVLTGCQLTPPKPGVGVRAAQVSIWRLPGSADVLVQPDGAGPFASVVVGATAPGLDRPATLTLDAAAYQQGARLRFLPAGPRLTVYAYFRDAAGRLEAGGVATGVLAGGTTALAPGWQPLAAPRALSGGPGISVADGVVIKGEAVRLSTGLPDAAPGVARVDVALAGPAYAGGTAQLGSFRAPQLATYTWSPGEPVGSYDPALMGGSGRLPFTLTATAYDAAGTPLGTTALALQIEGAASVGFGIHP